MNIWDRFRSRVYQPRHALGLWLSYRKLWTRGFVPSLRDRQQLRGRRPFWQVLGGATGEVAIPANQTVEVRVVCQSDFIACAMMISTSVGGAATNPGCRVQLIDSSSQPGRGKRFSIVGVNDSNFAGSAQHPRLLRSPYRFHAGHTIIARIQNLQNSTNKVQLVIEGVIDE